LSEPATEGEDVHCFLDFVVDDAAADFLFLDDVVVAEVALETGKEGRREMWSVEMEGVDGNVSEDNVEAIMGVSVSGIGVERVDALKVDDLKANCEK
jgi:hypothetical protein